MILSSLGFPKQLDVLLVITGGIFVLAFDTSLFHIKQDMEDLWSYEFDPELQENNLDMYLKYIIGGVIFVRTFTLHIFLAFYIVMLWPAIFADRPNLILPWLVVGLIRSILVNLVTLTTGSCVCVFLKGYHLICLDFVLSQIIQHGPSVYAWLTVLSYYNDLRLFRDGEKKKRIQDSHILTGRRTRNNTAPEIDFSEKTPVRSLLKNCLSESNLNSHILIIGKSGGSNLSMRSSRSLDSLIKTISEVQVSQFNSKREDIPSLSKKAMVMFNLTDEDVEKVKKEKSRSSLEGNKTETVITSVLPNADVRIERTKCSTSSQTSCISPRIPNTCKPIQKRCKCQLNKDSFETGEDSKKK